MTLLELLIVLALMAIVAAVTTMAARRQPPLDHADPLVMIEDSLRRAVSEARTITIATQVDGEPAFAVAHPDGRVIADSVFGVDSPAGRPRRER
jgi:prepilin-type N-terminal cleavage/methylation domain-containing protein